MTIRFVQARNYTKANRAAGDVTLVCVHTAECGEHERAAENLQSWTAGPNASRASWHYAVDSDSITQSCLEKDIAWHAGPINDFSIGIEHAGYASQTAEQWADAFSMAMLERSAELVAGICARYGIPIVRVTADDLKRGVRAGICGHVDVTMGLTQGKGHLDPGRFFPWDYFLGRVRAFADGGVVPQSSLSPSKTQTLSSVRDAQDALTRLRFQPGPVDGVNGVRTIAAVKAFQVSAGLKPDGILGPKTFGALEKAIADTFTRPPTPLRTSPGGFVEVEYAGAIWLVQPMPSAFCSIGEAVEAAKRAGCELPSPGLVDAIWRAADLRILPAVQSHDGTFAGMNAPAVYARVTAAVDAALAGRVPGQDVLLVAGAWKDVAVKNGKVGLYGAHVGDVAAFRARHGGIPLHAPETPGEGLIIQQFFAGHAFGWRDYSQSYRLCRRKT